ncbi:MAG: 3-oxoacyl-ACP synthase [Gemmatimonadetes bacterium RIFCSPLOWO2_02_FULL_71_11]|nr:MAG: 3-oxoacyl-ACP synthase [Gemmatimonadetes bacterium RIFCSPLOWO2_02_FULL_71_11]
MPRTEFISTGMYVPERVVTNDELTQWMDTSDEWIRTRSGIRERHWVRDGQVTSDLALEATKMALERAGMQAGDLDAIIFATLSPEYMFPGSGVYLQRKLGVSTIPCLDVRNQCTGFLYGLSVADAWVKTGQYKRVLLVGAEVQSVGIDLSTRGRDLAVLFGDGAGAVILGPTDDPGRGVLSTHIYADGSQADLLWCDLGGAAHSPRMAPEYLEQGLQWPIMQGREVFRSATTRMPEAVKHALEVNGLTLEDIKVLIPHQANLRISEMVQKQLGLRDDQVFNNIQKYGNTTAATIPMALHECLVAGKIGRGDLVMFAAFGSGFTWGSAAVKW